MILNRWKSFIVVVEEISKDGLARAVGLMMEVKKKVDKKVDIGQEGVRASSKVADVAEDKDVDKVVVMEVDKVVYKVADMVVNSVIQKINGKLVKFAV